MPARTTSLPETSLAAYKQLSYEHLAASWLMQGGWEVFKPLIDHGMKTDLAIADGGRLYRVQIKTLHASDEAVIVENKWQGAQIDYVIYFALNGEWGYKHPKSFLKAFGRV